VKVDAPAGHAPRLYPAGRGVRSNGDGSRG
jgi:hypothetical protein